MKINREKACYQEKNENILPVHTRNKLGTKVTAEEDGFIEEKGTRNAIFCLITLIKRSVQVKRNAYFCFIDYSKAFYCLNTDLMGKMLE